MPKRNDIKSILILGAGPIIIGQACEFDYAGTQACKALREEGYRILLINSNPATIMTDPNIADVTYIEPIHWKILHKIIDKERPDALLPTMGGQTALNCALDLSNKGILKKFNVEMIGITADAINKAEDRQYFKKIMQQIGLDTAKSGLAKNIKEAFLIVTKVGFPCIIRPSFTMGGMGGGIAYNYKQFKDICAHGLNISPINKLLIDESLIGWKEYEMEIMCDSKDNHIIVCSIENVDPMGIHTGDSITVAPAQTLTDKEYQNMRNAAIKVLRTIGIVNGGANVQFSVHPTTGRLIVIEMNPRVSRSSALASKATGFPIAKVAAKLAVGFTFDELTNDINKGYISALFEPSIDYVVTKIPRFNFEKFNSYDNKLTTQMKSVGEVMAIGRTQQESLQKALCGLEIDIYGFESKVSLKDPTALNIIRRELKYASNERIWYIADAFRANISINEIYNLTNIDPWFLIQIKELISLENNLLNQGIQALNKNYLRLLKRKGFSDAYIAKLVNLTEIDIRKLRENYNLHPVYKRVDTCAAEFSTAIAYMYSTYDEECESYPNDNLKKIMILGSGPNRIGQGIEFDYCCVHASMALREDGYETIIVNCNPETVSTDYDISDRLYFEPITIENILEIVRIEKPRGVIIQYGGQTPLKIARALENAGVPIIGTSPDDIDQAENRELFKQIVKSLGLKQPNNITVTNINTAIEKASIIGYPILVRPSYVLGGRAMKIVYNNKELINFFQNAINASNTAPVLLDQYIEDAIEVDIDAICDGNNVFIGGIMEHIEHAGIHSGDSACSLPAHTLSYEIQEIMRKQVKKLALKLKVCGLINVQLAVKNNEIYIIEVNPRAARTIPFVSKATGILLAKVAARVMIGKSLLEQGYIKEIIPPYFSVKEVVLPFNKFPGIDPILGPEMRSTGEIMGIGRYFSEAFSKVIFINNSCVKKNGYVLLFLHKQNKNKIIHLVIKLLEQGFKIDTTQDVISILQEAKINLKNIHKICEKYTLIQNKIKHGIYNYIINTIPKYKKVKDHALIRRSALQHKIYYNTTINGSFATIMSLNADATANIISLQEMHMQIIKK